MNPDFTTIVSNRFNGLASASSLFPAIPLPPKPLFAIAVISFVCALITRRLSTWKGMYNLALRALRHGGEIPKHIAIVMDGNRRWARRLGLPPSQGHPQGGEKLIESLQWCLEAGVETVTVFAFSIENFKRSSTEVSEIMALAERTFYRFMNRQHVLHERRVRVRFLGDLTFISPPLRRLMIRLMNDSAQYTDGPTLNICFAYAARHDMASAISDVVNLCREDSDKGRALLHPGDINADVIAACLASGSAKGKGTGGNYSFPDLLIRTSGETRLSDFLMWESSQCILSFYPALWPELSVWDFVKILLQYQRHARIRKTHYASLEKRTPAVNEDVQKDTRVREGIDKVRQTYCDAIASYMS